MEEQLDKIKNLAKSLWRKIPLHIKAIIALVLVVLLIFLTIAVYIVDLDDASYDSTDENNVPFKVESFLSDINISKDGKIHTDKSVQDLWDDMKKNKSRVTQYLSNASELKKLINAEIVTKYINPNPDEDIDWNDNNNPKSTDVKGIIKLKRAKSDGKYTYLKYVDSETYYSWIEQYNNGGSNKNSLKNDILSHYTLEKGYSTSSNNSNNGSSSNSSNVSSLDNFLFIGDSRYEGIKTQLQALGQNINVASVVSSSPAQWVDVVKKGGGTVLSQNVSLPSSASGISVMLGVNDTSQISKMQELLIAIHAKYPNSPIFVNSVYHVGAAYTTINSTQMNNNINNFNRSMQTFCNQNNWLYYIDVSQNLYDTSGYLKFEYSKDGLHINIDAGKQVIVENIKNGILSSGGVEDKSSSSSSSTGSTSSSNSTDLTSNSSGNLTYTSSNQWTDISEAIVNTAKKTPSPGAGLCQAWVSNVYRDAGLGDVRYEGAYQAFLKVCVSTDTTNIPIGATVYGTGSNKPYNGTNNPWGHVGIYVGDINGDGEGEVIDNVGHINISKLSDWIAWQEKAGNLGCDGRTPGWLGWGWNCGSPTRFLNDEEAKEAESRAGTEQAIYTVSGVNYAQQNGNLTYYAVVAQWSETENKFTSTDPDYKDTTSTAANISTTRIDYQQIVSKYKMPYDYLWALLVMGEDKDFVLELADLVYNSEIEITIHENLSTTTQTIPSTHVKYKTITDKFGDKIRNTTKYSDTTIITTKNATLNTKLTRANVWMCDYQQDFTYDSSGTWVSSPAKTTEKTDKESTEPNFVTIFNSSKRAKGNIVSAPDWLFEALESSEDTQDMIDLTKYLLYKATGKDYGVTTFDFELLNTSNSNQIGGAYYGNSIAEKLWFALRDAGYSEEATAGALGNIDVESGGFQPGIEELDNGIGYGLCQWSFGRRTQLEAYARSSNRELSDVNMQIEFLLTEMTPGAQGPAAGFAQYNFMYVKGYDRDKWINAITPEDAATAFMYSFERPAEGGLLRRRQESARKYYNQFKGKTKPEGGNIIEVADKIHKYMEKNNYSYTVTKTLDRTFEESKTKNHNVCCATYVSWVLQEAGYISDSEHLNGATALSNLLEKKGWTKITNISDLKAGDVLYYQSRGGHVEIYAGYDQMVYNAGGNNSVKGASPSKSGRGLNTLTCAWRAPGQ